MANADQTRRNSSRWPQVTLREILLLMAFFAVLYGFDVMRGDRESLLADVKKTPILLAVFLLWRIVQHCRSVEHVFARVFVDGTLGASVGAMGGTVLGMVSFSHNVPDVLFGLFLGACFGAISANIAGLLLGRYRRNPTAEEDQ